MEFNAPVGLGNVAVYAGDVILGNEEGVVVIPAHLVDEVADECLEVAAYEAFVQRELKRGRSIFGLFPATPESRVEYENWVAQGRPEEEK